MAEVQDDNLFDDMEDEANEGQSAVKLQAPHEAGLFKFEGEEEEQEEEPGLEPKEVDSDIPDLDDIHRNEHGEPVTNPQSPIIEQLLASKGIKGTVIQMENEEGEIEDVDFWDLPEDEQLAILQSSDADIDHGLAQPEIEAVNFLRQNNITLEEAREYFRREAVQEYIDSQNIVGIETEQYSDTELYALDLKAKFDDLTEEDIEIELNKQLEHPELFKKKVDKLRTEYKEMETAQRDAVRLQEEQEAETKRLELQNSLVSVAQGVADIGGLDLDNDDKNEVLNFLLEKDINGVSPFLKTLDSPEQLFELAWFATKGKQAFEIIHDYYRTEIDKVNKAAYKKGKEEALTKTKTEARPRVQARRLPDNNRTTNKQEYPDLDSILQSNLKD